MVVGPVLQFTLLGAFVTGLLSAASRRGIAASLDDSGLRQDPPPDTAALLVRAAQEARNVVAHSQPNAVAIRLRVDRSAATVEMTRTGAR